MSPSFPSVLDPSKVGHYPALAGAGGGLVWDEVLEYRVWLHPERGAADAADGDDYFQAFATAAEAQAFALATAGAEEPVALVLQREYLRETDSGHYEHVRRERLTEWPLEFLQRPRRNPETIPRFLAPDAPAHRLDILRGVRRS
ncbi:MAG: GCN5 family acetyltransferase [Verrucomicrobia bacterium]|nr:GCN5 family acetyltransferase [Verrucomicrobiota bacterium]